MRIIMRAMWKVEIQSEFQGDNGEDYVHMRNLIADNQDPKCVSLWEYKYFDLVTKGRCVYPPAHSGPL